MLKYLGGGYIAGVPAKDLTEDAVKSLAKSPLGRTVTEVRSTLIKSGLYEAAASKNKEEKKTPEEDKNEGGGN